VINPLAALKGPPLANPDGSMSLMEHLSSTAVNRSVTAGRLSGVRWDRKWSRALSSMAGRACRSRAGGRVGMASHALARAVEKEPGVHVRRPVGEGRLSIAARTVLTVTAASSDEFGTAVLLTQMVRLTESIREAHAQAGRLVLARAAAEAAERGVAALARVGGPRELTAAPTAVVGVHALAVEQANRAAGSRITPGLTSGDQPVPGTRKDTDRGMER